MTCKGKDGTLSPPTTCKDRSLDGSEAGSRRSGFVDNSRIDVETGLGEQDVDSDRPDVETGAGEGEDDNDRPDLDTGFDEWNDWTGTTGDDSTFDVPSVYISPRDGDAGDEHGR